MVALSGKKYLALGLPTQLLAAIFALSPTPDAMMLFFTTGL